MTSTQKTPRQVQLGLFIRQLRRRAGLTQAALAAQMGGRSNSHPSRWENGILLIEQAELELFLRLVGASSEETVEALKLHRDASDPDWQIPGVGRGLAVVREYEDDAIHVMNVQPSLIPGPLQTERYARSIIVAAGATDVQADDWTAFRMARRDSWLSRETPYEAIIGEYALRWPACTPEVGAEQLEDLQMIAELPHFTVRVLPFGFGFDPARVGSFVLIETATTKVVHLDQYRSSTTLTNTRDVRDYTDAAETLRRAAMSPVASTRLIAEIAHQLENTT